MPDTDTQGVALEQRLRELAHLRYAPMQRASEEWQAADLIGDLREQVERLERENETYRTAFDGIETAAQEGREAVAWLTEGYGYKRVFLEREAAEKLARGGDGTVSPLYTHPAPAQPAAQVVSEAMVDAACAAYHAAYHDGTSQAGQQGMRAALTAALASPTNADAAQVTEGYVLVPVEPTEAMIFAGHHQIDWCRDKQNTHQPEHPSQTDGGGTSCKEDILDAWKAMLTAAKAGEDGR